MGFLRKTRSGFRPAPNLVPKKTVTVRYGDVNSPAASVNLIKQNGVSFEKKVTSAVNMQKKLGVGGVAWDVISLLDESYSMGGLFADGTVQEVTERALAWTAAVDSDGMAPVGGFASGFRWHGEVDLTNVRDIVRREGWGCWGSTDLTSGLQEALEVAKGATNPVYLFIVTDGAPNDQASAVSVIKEMSQYPIFVKILLVGNDPRGKAFVEYLDDLEQHEPGGRLFDNVDAQHIVSPSRVSDDDFNTAMTEELKDALDGMKAVGLTQ